MISYINLRGHLGETTLLNLAKKMKFAKLLSFYKSLHW